jgi:hypothetical protein
MTTKDDRARNEWRKSSYSNNGGNCVEAAVLGPDQAPATGRLVAMRDSQDPAGPRLHFTPAQWTTFARGIRNGAFDSLS